MIKYQYPMKDKIILFSQVVEIYVPIYLWPWGQNNLAINQSKKSIYHRCLE